jgi:phosphatidylglycerol:prolipoprotein diacylglycerol transferase
MGIEGAGLRARERAIQAAMETGLWERVRLGVPLRHPSQLYEALGEGALLGAILWAMYAVARRQGWTVPHGVYGGSFLVGYGLVRMAVERFRQPDPQFRGPGDPLGTVLGPLTMGQLLSLVMITAGLILLVGVLRRSSSTSIRPC